MNDFFVDSTVWIEFLRGKNKLINDLIIPLIDEDRIYYNGIILNELLIGAVSEQEYNFIKNNFKGFKYLEAELTIFERASLIGFNLRRSGITIPITDLIIAAHCIFHDLTIITLDKHFKLISEKSDLKTKFIKY